jgi:phospholipase C
VSHSAAGTAVAILILTVGFAAPAAIPPAGSHGNVSSSGWPSAGAGLAGVLPNDHIHHVVTVMMENHDYDSYFGTYCQTKGPYCSVTGNGIPPGTCVPYYPTDVSAGCVVPFNMTPADFTINDMEHDWYSGPIAIDGGAMDGFYDAEGTTNTFGHYNGTTIPIYWDMAEEYASADNFWGANLSYSLPNHWYLVSATTPAIAYDTYMGWDGVQSTYLDEANNTTTIEDLLVAHNISWKYYDTSLEPYSQAVNGGMWGTAYDYWNPMAAKAESYVPSYDRHFVPRADFITDVQDGDLPSVSYVIPDFSFSDHPGSNNSAGEAWVSQLVNAVEDSQYWNSTVIFVTWDDYGGWYDHVAPPTILGEGLSLRAPLLVISPYAKENYISHDQLDFMSLLHFVEWQFGLGCLRPLDCLAPLPLGLFDFSQIPRAPILFGTAWDTTSYPMPLQQAGAVNTDCADCRVVNTTAWDDNSATPSAGLVSYS